MSLRSRLAEPPVPVAKVFGPGVPPAIAVSEAQQQMTPDSPFSPGTPIGPYDGYSRTPRARDYVTGYNIATRPRLHERVSFDTLKGLIRSYDVAGIAIWHRIDSLRSVKYRLNAADGYNGDISGAVAAAAQVLRKPDRKHNFKAWFGKWMWDVLAYDAGALYRMRNRAGRCVGLMPVDGTTLAPLLDYWGNEPEPPAESHVQYANGLPWNWLTRDDLIYEPMRAVNDSIYGHAPIETIMLNANTDIRFQLHFLQRFTEGNIPAAFASAPESWTPEQIEQFQELWDSFMYGDQTRKSQIRWLPGGSTFTWTNEKDFTDQFSLFMMRKTCACFHVVPTDLGFTDSSNYSTGESQADVAHKVGELPLMEYVEEILSQFLYDDLGLPLKFEFDRGEDQDDRLVQAQADDIYIKNGSVGTEEIREMRYGLPKSARPVPRFIYSERGGPVPLNALMAVGGDVDPETGAPTAEAPLPHDAFSEVEGVESNPPVLGTPLAVQEYGPSALPPAPPQQPLAPGSPQPAAKEAAGADGAGITSDTGIYGDPLLRDEDERAGLAKAELAAFRRFARARRKAGEWRDFRFAAVDPQTARRLNGQGRASVAKEASGYDLNPRSGMISLDVPDGLIEPVPDGVTDFHVTVVYLGPDVDDEAFGAACQRAQSAAASVSGPLSGTISGVGAFPPSASSDGKVPAWAAVAVPGAEQLREALGDLSASEHKDWMPHVTLAYVDEGDPLPAPLAETPVTFTHLSVRRGGEVARFPLGPAPVTKGVAKSSADEVFHQLTEDYPKSSLEWVHQAVWEGPFIVPFSELDTADRDSWRASHEPDRVQSFADRIKTRTGKGKTQLKKPAVVVFEPGAKKALIVDGHHRTLGAQRAGEEGVLAWVGHVASKDGPWLELHNLQFTNADGSAAGSGDDVAADQVGKAAAPVVSAPKAPDAQPPVQQAWPGWDLDLQTAAYWVPILIGLFTSALSAQDIATGWLEQDATSAATTKPQRIRDLAAQAGSWLGKDAQPLQDAITDAVQGIRTDGFAIGARSAQAAAQAGGIAADMGTWTPGARQVASELAGEMGGADRLASLLRESGVTIRSIAESRLGDLARVLAEGTEQGLGVDDLADAIGGLLSNPERAHMIVLTELARAANSAAMWAYRLHGVERVTWVTAEDDHVCPACEAEEIRGPRPLGDGESPPLHPRCRCALVPA